MSTGRLYALLTDLYQLTMLQAYVIEDMFDTAVFDLFARRLPRQRNYLIACGLDDALVYLETLHFDDAALAYLASIGKFKAEFLDYLASFRFSGDVYAVPEGTVVFPGEPILEVVASLPQAQFVESFLLNQIHFQTLVASKVSRVVTAARGKPVIDFGLRRYHGIDAGLKAARAAYIAGAQGTSNVLAGQRYGIPVSGTMAHSYVLAHSDEAKALAHFAEVYPDTVLLVDTYDTLAGVRKVVALAKRLGSEFHVRAIRLDSGDLLELSRQSRRILDDAGLQQVGIFASGELNESRIDNLLTEGAPIDAFGVGTRMGTSADAPFIDSAYKLVAYAGEHRMKLSTGKATLPGRKQVYRLEKDGYAVGDVMALHGESQAGKPLIQPVMREGRKLTDTPTDLVSIRDHCQREIAALPKHILQLPQSEQPYPVSLSSALETERRRLSGKQKPNTSRLILPHE